MAEVDPVIQRGHDDDRAYEAEFVEYRATHDVRLRNRLIVALQWLWSYMTFERGTRLITGSDR